MDDIPSNIGYLADNYKIGYIQNGSTNKFKWIVKEKNGIKYWKRYDLIKDNPLNPSTPRKETFNIDINNSLSRKKVTNVKKKIKIDDKITEHINQPQEDIIYNKSASVINIGETDILKDVRVRKYLNEMRGKERQKIDKLKKKYMEENLKMSKELTEEKSRREYLEREKQEYVRKKELRKIALMERRKRMKEANQQLNNVDVTVSDEINDKNMEGNADNNVLVALGGRKALTPRSKGRRSVKFTKKIQVFNYVKESIPSLNSNELNIYMDKL